MSTNRRFSEFRKKLNLSQSQMAEALGVERTAVTNYEKEGRIIPNYIKIILRFQFRLNRKWFDEGEGEMFIEEGEKNERLGKENFDSHNESEKEEVRKMILDNNKMIKKITDLLEKQGDIISHFGWQDKMKKKKIVLLS